MEGGAAWRDLFVDIAEDVWALGTSGDLGAMAAYLTDALDALRTATVWMTGNGADAAVDTAAGATPYLRMFALVTGGWLLAKQARVAAQRLDAGAGDPAFLKAKIATARFFAEQVLPQANALLGPVTRGAGLLYAVPEESLLAA
jgi:hypothetical protein